MSLEELEEFVSKTNASSAKNYGIWDSTTYTEDRYKAYKFKMLVCKKLTDIIGYPVKSISANFRGHFKKLYNVEITSSTGNRTLKWNGNVICTVKVLAATFSIIEYALMDVIADLIMAKPNYVPGKLKPIEVFTVGGHLHRIFGYSDNSTVTTTIANRIYRQFGGRIETDIDDIPVRDNIHTLRFQVILHETIIKTIECEVPIRRNRYSRSLDYNRIYTKASNEAWMFLLEQLPNWNGQSRTEETNEMKLVAISQVISSKLPSNEKLLQIRSIMSRKYNK